MLEELGHRDLTQLPWAPAEIFPEGGKTTDSLKIGQVFGAPWKISTIFLRAKGANEKNITFFVTF